MTFPTQPSALSTQPSALSTQPSALSPQYSALSPQYSVLSPQPSALSPQYSVLSTMIWVYFRLTRQTILQPSPNSPRLLTPSKPLDPTLANSYKMFFQNVTRFIPKSSKISIGCRGGRLSARFTPTHLNIEPTAAIVVLTRYSALSTSRMAILASDIPTTFCRSLSRATRRNVTKITLWHCRRRRRHCRHKPCLS